MSVERSFGRAGVPPISNFDAVRTVNDSSSSTGRSDVSSTSSRLYESTAHSHTYYSPSSMSQVIQQQNSSAVGSETKYRVIATGSSGYQTTSTIIPSTTATSAISLSGSTAMTPVRGTTRVISHSPSVSTYASPRPITTTSSTIVPSTRTWITESSRAVAAQWREQKESEIRNFHNFVSQRTSAKQESRKNGAQNYRGRANKRPVCAVDWSIFEEKMPSTQDYSTNRAFRKSLYERFDSRDVGHLTLEDTINGLKNIVRFDECIYPATEGADASSYDNNGEGKRLILEFLYRSVIPLAFERAAATGPYREYRSPRGGAAEEVFTLERIEFRLLLVFLKHYLTMYCIFDAADKAACGTLDTYEFEQYALPLLRKEQHHRIMTVRPLSQLQSESADSIFRSIDVKKTGEITFQDLVTYFDVKREEYSSPTSTQQLQNGETYTTTTIYRTAAAEPIATPNTSTTTTISAVSQQDSSIHIGYRAEIRSLNEHIKSLELEIERMRLEQEIQENYKSQNEQWEHKYLELQQEHKRHVEESVRKVSEADKEQKMLRQRLQDLEHSTSSATANEEDNSISSQKTYKMLTDKEKLCRAFLYWKGISYELETEAKRSSQGDSDNAELRHLQESNSEKALVITRLESELAQVTTQMNEYSEQLTIIRQKEQDSSSHEHQLQDEMREKVLMIERLEEETARMRTEISEYQQINSDFQQRSNHADGLESRLKSVEEDNHSLRAELQRIETDLINAKSALQEKEDQLSTVGSRAGDFEAQMCRVREELQQTNQEAEEKMQHQFEVIQQLRADKASLESQLEMLQANQAELQSEFRSVTERSSELQIQLQTVTEELRESRAQASTKDSAYNEQIASLQGELQQTRDENRTRRAGMDEMQNEWQERYSELQHRMDEELQAEQQRRLQTDQHLDERLQRAKSEHEADAQEKQVVIDKLREELQRINTEWHLTQTELTSIRSEQQDLVMLREKYARLEDDLRNEKEHLSEQQRRYEHQITQLQSDMSTARHDWDAQLQALQHQNQQLQGSVEVVVQERTHLQSMLDAANDEVQELTRRLAMRTTDCETSKAAAEKYQCDVTELQGQLKAMNEENADKYRSITAELEVQKQKNHALSGTLQEEQHNTATLQCKLEHLTNAVSDQERINNLLENSEARYRKLDQEHHSSSVKYQTEISRLSKELERCRRYETEAGEYVIQVKTLQTILEEKERSIISLQDEVDGERSRQSEAMRAERDSLQSHHRSLTQEYEAQLARLREELHNARERLKSEAATADQVYSLELQVQKQRDEMSEASSAHDRQLQQERARLAEQLQTNEANFERKISQLKHEVAEERESRNTEALLHNSEVAKLQKELELQDAAMRDLRNSTKEEKMTMQDSFNSKCAAFESQIRQLKREAEGAASLAQYEGRISHLEGALRQSEADNDELRGRLKADRLQLEEQMSSKQRTYEETISSLRREIRDRNDTHEMELSTTTLKMQRIEQDLIALQFRFDNVSTERNDLEKKLEHTRGEMKTASSSHMKQLQSERDSVQILRQQYEDRIRQLEIRIDELSTEKSRLLETSIGSAKLNVMTSHSMLSPVAEPSPPRKSEENRMAELKRSLENSKRPFLGLGLVERDPSHPPAQHIPYSETDADVLSVDVMVMTSEAKYRELGPAIFFDTHIHNKVVESEPTGPVAHLRVGSIYQGGPAWAEGLRTGDEILRIGTREVFSLVDVRQAVFEQAKIGVPLRFVARRRSSGYSSGFAYRGSNQGSRVGTPRGPAITTNTDTFAATTLTTALSGANSGDGVTSAHTRRLSGSFASKSLIAPPPFPVSDSTSSSNTHIVHTYKITQPSSTGVPSTRTFSPISSPVADRQTSQHPSPSGFRPFVGFGLVELSQTVHDTNTVEGLPVDTIHRGGPAWVAGIRLDDLVIEIGPPDAPITSLAQVRAAIRQHGIVGQPLRVVVQRGGGVHLKNTHNNNGSGSWTSPSQSMDQMTFETFLTVKTADESVLGHQALRQYYVDPNSMERLMSDNQQHV